MWSSRLRSDRKDFGDDHVSYDGNPRGRSNGNWEAVVRCSDVAKSKNSRGGDKAESYRVCLDFEYKFHSTDEEETRTSRWVSFPVLAR